MYCFFSSCSDSLFQYLLSWIFEKVISENLAIFSGTTPKLGKVLLLQSASKPHEKEGRRKGRERWRKKNRQTHIFYIAYFQL